MDAAFWTSLFGDTLETLKMTCNLLGPLEQVPRIPDRTVADAIRVLEDIERQHARRQYHCQDAEACSLSSPEPSTFDSPESAVSDHMAHTSDLSTFSLPVPHVSGHPGGKEGGSDNTSEFIMQADNEVEMGYTSDDASEPIMLHCLSLVHCIRCYLEFARSGVDTLEYAFNGEGGAFPNPYDASQWREFRCNSPIVSTLEEISTKVVSHGHEAAGVALEDVKVFRNPKTLLKTFLDIVKRGYYTATVVSGVGWNGLHHLNKPLLRSLVTLPGYGTEFVNELKQRYRTSNRWLDAGFLNVRMEQSSERTQAIDMEACVWVTGRDGTPSSPKFPSISNTKTFGTFADNVVPAIPQAVLAAPSTSIDVVTPELTPAQRLFFSIPSATDLSVERRDALLKDTYSQTTNTHLKPQLTAEEAYLLDLKEAEDYIDVTSRMGDHRPLAPLQGVDCTGRRLFFWVPNAVSALAPGITSTVEKFVEKYPPVKSAKDNRHVNWDLQPTHNGVYHLGVWQPTGGAPGGDIGTSAETFPGSSGKTDAVVEFLRHQHILGLAETVQALFRRLDPDMAGRYSAAIGRLKT
ncbi:hypothetical protein BJ742DRAFT_781654 [Cladochytrium replicatum]|nr:hypothetical protein BJ742DRAFT_781654 [Cladochytrium replicatum]